jgi:Raf kinase inhibitor-like YbhB/YbcL family protein
MRAIAAVIALAGLTSCGGGSEVTTESPFSITVSSPAFGEGQPIPQRFSCRGDNVSPPLAWAGTPGSTQEIALVMDDPDAPRGTYTHWIIFGLSRETSELGGGMIPAGAKQAENSAGQAEYTGPCPPSGTHHYRFTVYALDEPLSLPDGAGTEDALTEIGEQAIARGRLTGTFASG